MRVNLPLTSIYIYVDMIAGRAWASVACAIRMMSASIVPGRSLCGCPIPVFPAGVRRTALVQVPSPLYTALSLGSAITRIRACRGGRNPLAGIAAAGSLSAHAPRPLSGVAQLGDLRIH